MQNKKKYGILLFLLGILLSFYFFDNWDTIEKFIAQLFK